MYVCTMSTVSTYGKFSFWLCLLTLSHLLPYSVLIAGGLALSLTMSLVFAIFSQELDVERNSLFAKIKMRVCRVS
jgi:hypothetical protein